MGQALAEFLCNDVARVLLALLLIGGTLVLLVMRIEVPNFLIALDGAAVGFYFYGEAQKSSR